MASDGESKREKLSNTHLWVRLDARGMTRINEIQLANIVLETLCSELGENNFVPYDILGAQFLQDQQCWIIYMGNEPAKRKLLSLGTLTINNRQFDLRDFQRIGVTKPTIRVSIHGIPLHVPDAEVEQWIDMHLERDTPVTLAKPKHDDPKFMHLYSGNRFCYARRIITPIPRYTTFYMTDPLQMQQSNPDLMETNVTVYHDGQPVNCRKCHEHDHEIQNCPKISNFSKSERKCYKCGLTNHIARDCTVYSTNQISTNESTVTDEGISGQTQDETEFESEIMQESVQKILFSHPETEKENITHVQSKKDIEKQPHGAKEQSVRPKNPPNPQKKVSQYFRDLQQRETYKRQSNFTPPSSEKVNKKTSNYKGK